MRMLLFLISFLFVSCTVDKSHEKESVEPYILVLGIAQDGGVPQAGTDHPGWENAEKAEKVVSLGIIDPQTSSRWMIEATPDFRKQLHLLDRSEPVSDTPGLDGIFLTHAHIGHYTGLMFLGHESVGADRVPVYVMPGMGSFLAKNGPWDQLIRYENIVLKPLSADSTVRLNSRIEITPFLVPHRQEYSEVVGYKIEGPNKSVLFIPDIDSWEEWEQWGTSIEKMIPKMDYAFLDATFFADGEIPGRDMSNFPHPFITHSMNRFKYLSPENKSKVYFIHLNHTNPALDPESREREIIFEKGFNIAREMQKVEL